MNFLRNLNVGTKIYACVAVLIFMMVGMAVSVSLKLNTISGELHAITEEDIPLTEVVTNITVHQLEASVELERMVRHGAEMAHDPHQAELFEETREKFTQITKKIDEEIKAGEAFVEAALGRAHDEAAVKEFEHVNSLLHKIEQEHEAFDHVSQEIAALLKENHIAEAVLKIDELEVGQAQLNQELETLSLELEKFTEAASASVLHHEESAANFMIMFSVIAVIVGVGLSIMIIRSITTPLSLMLAAADDLRDGDGDLTQRLPYFGTNEIGQVADAFNGFIDKIQDVLLEVKSSVDNLGIASEQVSSTAQSLSQGASEQAASLEETSSSLEQMSASINLNSENSRMTDSMATKASGEAEAGGKAVHETLEAMKSIASKISIIEDIAYKTNLLALNAAIEAARAGDHGKGFAVVAAEVRKLAERSQVSAQEISDLAEGSVKVAEQAGKLLDDIVPSITKTADLVQEISAASEEQAAGVGQVNIAVTEMDKVSQHNAAASEQLAATAEEMTSQAQQLQETVGFFRLESGGDGGVFRDEPATTKVSHYNSPSSGPDEGDFESFQNVG